MPDAVFDDRRRFAWPFDAEGGGDAFERVRQLFGRLRVASGECRAQGGRRVGLVIGILPQHSAEQALVAAHPVQAVDGVEPGNSGQPGERSLATLVSNSTAIC